MILSKQCFTGKRTTSGGEREGGGGGGGAKFVWEQNVARQSCLRSNNNLLVSCRGDMHCHLPTGISIGMEIRLLNLTHEKLRSLLL